MRRLAQSTSRVVTFEAFLASDHVTPATGKTIAITLSKNGGAFANPNVGALNATEIGSTGIYKITLDTTDTGTLGDLWVHGAVATIDNVDFVSDVVAVSVAQTGDNYARLGAPVGASISADIAQVEANAVTIAGYVDTEVAAIKAKTDNLPATPAATGDAMTLTSGERNSIADAHLDRADAIEVGLTPRQKDKLVSAALFGKASGAGTVTNVVRNAIADTKNRLTFTTDSSGNRPAVVVDLT